MMSLIEDVLWRLGDVFQKAGVKLFAKRSINKLKAKKDASVTIKFKKTLNS